MSPVITFDDDDILRNRIVPVAWYRVRIERVSQKPSTSGNPETSLIFPINGRILFNAENGSMEHAGVPTPPSWNFNDNPKAKGFMIGYFMAFGVDVRSGVGFELRATEGKELDVFIEQDMYEGRTVNRINHKYRKPNPETVPVNQASSEGV